ncbi:MAG: hypothetical protein LRY51_02455 [Geovibrio sp.]|nr:hypothetical protein [Geovibrio sp.]
MESISRSSVTLSQIAPELDQAAKSLGEQSKIQAEKAVQIAPQESRWLFPWSM